jgi:carboxyl-terminal processing protease
MDADERWIQSGQAQGNTDFPCTSRILASFFRLDRRRPSASIGGSNAFGFDLLSPAFIGGSKGLRNLATGIALVLAVAGCASLDPNNVITRQLPSGSTSGALDAPARSDAFDFVWTTVNERYYDPRMNGVDWNAAKEKFRPLALGAANDDEFWDELDRMTGEMKDGHTRVESPKQAALREKSSSVSLGFGGIELDGVLVVSSVNPEGDAWWAGVRSGMTLVSIDGKDALARLRTLRNEVRNSSTAQARERAAVRKLLLGEPGTRAVLVFRRADGSTLAADLERRTLNSPPRVISRRLPSGYGYVRFSEFRQGLQGDIIERVRGLRDTPGMIIDLRGNPGGSLYMVWNIASEFLAEPTVAGRTLTRDGKPITLFFNTIEIMKLEQKIDGRGADAYQGPVVVLVDRGSASGSEMLAGSLQALGRAKVVGETSCGCLLGYFGYAQVPGGGRLAYSEIGFVLSDGRRIEGIGVVPDKQVAITAADLQLGRDRTLEDAEALLATMKK